MKLARADKFAKHQTYNKIIKKEARKIYEQKNNLHGDEYPTVEASNADLSPPTEPSVGVGESMTPRPKNAEGFRPTAPGHSPGVGHSLQN